MNGINIAGVQFQRAGKIYDFAAGDLAMRVGDSVVVETDRGLALGTVALFRFIERTSLGERELKAVVRVASAKELARRPKMSEDEALTIAKERVGRHKLQMRPLKVEILFGGSKILVYFSAPGRIDFRELVRDLAGALRARVELKQIGSRDETKVVGGIGICGREYCCSSFLREFVPVSIRMAKNQNLALNPAKVSGGCGRLLCCLTYENDVYTLLRKSLPPRGTRIQLADGTYADVIRSDLLNQIVYGENDQGQEITSPISEIKIVARGEGAKATTGDDWVEDVDFEALGENLDD